ncbi:DMT family transporter [Pseudomarimonas salicorniae]|uniref:DMT family transporter n=1 Tax=Pseudomarimonas salicorniae TaxID=2933270 RepID=A0ABT0GI53_9GAMM|nr:DMT family transporter [Lysobacter sp. CAU 1642]MCK7594236.1 DMT family transporter [Lysobacter sp. CAU 1642]
MSQAQATLPPVEELASRDWRTPFELCLLGAIWGASFMLMRVAAPEFGAVPLVELRLASGALILLPFLIAERRRFPARLWPTLALIGCINSAGPFVLFAFAAKLAPAGIGAICNAMTVLFTALIAALFFGERIGWRRAIALGTGFAGVAILASARIEGAAVGLAVAAGTFASFLYGIGANLVRKHLTGMPPAAVAAATLSCASLATLPFAAANWPQVNPSLQAWGAALLLGVVCTGLAFVVFYRLIKRVGASRAVVVTYLIPLFGVLWAWSLLGEPITLTMLVAGLLIVGSVALSQRRPV